jgi:FAD/FMN-containing dehydrogenase
MTTPLKNLQSNIQGEVFSNTSDVAAYTTDESIFTVQPHVVVCPKNDQDIVATVEWANENNISITARGGGTGVAGQSIGSGIILDFSKHMNQILNLSKERAIVQPGVVLGNLNQKALEFGSKFGPDPGSWDRCTIGGIIATNAAGPHALMYGSTRDHVELLDLVLSNGKQTSSRQLSKDMDSYVQQISKQADLIRKTKRNVDKNSSGYYLEALLEKPASFEKLIVGSEGTLALVTQATLKLVELPKKISFAVFGFESMGKALMNVNALRESGACCIELLDQTILNVVRKKNPELLRGMGIENASASLWVEWNQEIPDRWEKMAGYSTEDSEDICRIWKQRSNFSKWLHAQAEKENRKPLRCIEDACVPMDALIQYVMALSDLMERHDCRGAIFGHVGNGHLHVNPAIRTDLPNLVERIQKLMDEFHDIVIGLGGTISGEHGDGILRVPYAKKQWKDIWPLFEFIKRSFDPKGILNPDRKVPVQYYPWPELKY